MEIIDQNAKEIASKKRSVLNPTETFQLKQLAVSLNRQEELQRIQAYYDSLNQ